MLGLCLGVGSALRLRVPCHVVVVAARCMLLPLPWNGDMDGDSDQARCMLLPWPWNGDRDGDMDGDRDQARCMLLPWPWKRHMTSP